MPDLTNTSGDEIERLVVAIVGNPISYLASLKLIDDVTTKWAINIVRKTHSFALAGAVRNLTFFSLASAAAIGLAWFRQARSLEELADAADRLRVSTAQLSAWNHAAQVAGMQAGQFTSQIESMTNTIQAAIIRGSKSLGSSSRGPGGVFKALGIHPENLQGLPVQRQLEIVGQALDKVADKQTRAALASRLFDGNAAEMLQLLENNQAKLRALSADAEHLALILTNKQVVAVKAARGELRRMWEAFGGIEKQITAVAAPAMQRFAHYATELFGFIGRFIQRHEAWVKVWVYFIFVLGAAIGVIFTVGAGLYALEKAILAVRGAIIATRIAVLALTSHPLVALITLVGAALLVFLHWAGALDWIYEKMSKIAGLTSNSMPDFTSINSSAAWGPNTSSATRSWQDLLDAMKQNNYQNQNMLSALNRQQQPAPVHIR